MYINKKYKQFIESNLQKGKKIIEEENKKYLKDVQLTPQQYMFSIQVPVIAKSIDNKQIPKDPLFMMQQQNGSNKNINMKITFLSILISVLAPSKEFQQTLEKIRNQSSQKPIMNDLPFQFSKPQNKNNKEVYFNFILNDQFCFNFLKSSERRNDLIFHMSNIMQFLLNKELYIFDDFKKYGPIMIQYEWEQSELINRVLSKDNSFQFQNKLQVNIKYNNRLEQKDIQNQNQTKLNSTQDLLNEIKKSQNEQPIQQVNIDKKNIDQTKKSNKVKIEVLEERNQIIQNVQENEQKFFKNLLMISNLNKKILIQNQINQIQLQNLSKKLYSKKNLKKQLTHHQLKQNFTEIKKNQNYFYVISNKQLLFQQMKNLFKICKKQIHLFENPTYRFLKSDNKDKITKWNNLSIYEKTSTLSVFEEDLQNDKNQQLLKDFYNELLNNMDNLHEHDIYQVLKFLKSSKNQDKHLQKSLINQLLNHKQPQLIQEIIDEYKFDYDLFDDQHIIKQIHDNNNSVNLMIDLVHIALKKKINTQHYFSKYLGLISQQRFIVNSLKNLMNIHNLQKLLQLPKLQKYEQNIEKMLIFFDKKIMPQRLLYFDNNIIIYDLLFFYKKKLNLFEKQSFMLDFFYNKLIQLILINEPEKLSVSIFHFLCQKRQNRIQDHQINQILKYFEQHFDQFQQNQQLQIIEAICELIKTEKIQDSNTSYQQILQQSKYVFKDVKFNQNQQKILDSIKLMNPDFYLIF